jgi:aspartate aminotransferase
MGDSGFVASDRAQATKLSSVAAIVMAAERLRSQGVDIVDLGAGEPDFPTPEYIKAAAIQALDENFTRYTAASGILPLKEAICATIEKDFGANYSVPQCSVTVGGKNAIFNAVLALINPGDDVLIERPAWVSFPEIIRFAGGSPVEVHIEDNDFHLTAAAVRDAITPKTRLLIINSPSNPTGRVIDPAEFERIVTTAAERGIWVISDECYVQFVYPPGKPFSAAALSPELRDRTLIAGSFSKTYAMTGWRIGFVLGPEAWVTEVTKISSQSTSNVNSITQRAALAALTGPQESVEMMLKEYTRRRDWLIPALNQIPGITCGMPEGAFYAFPDVRGLMKDCGFSDSKQLADTLLYEYGVVCTSGGAFGAEGYLRLSYANSMTALEEGVARIRGLRDARANR